MFNKSFDEAVEKINKHIDDYAKKFEILKDVFEIKEKHSTKFVTALETEIYPFIEDKINIKLTKQMDQRVAKMRNDMVSKLEFEFIKDEIINQITQNKEYQ